MDNITLLDSEGKKIITIYSICDIELGDNKEVFFEITE